MKRVFRLVAVAVILFLNAQLDPVVVPTAVEMQVKK